MAKKPGTAVATWDDELAEQAKVAAAQVQTLQTGNKFLSLKSGVLSFDGKPFPNNEMAVIIMDHVFANAHYTGRYDPANPASPDCYAFGRDAGSMAPHENIDKAACHSERCATCEMNVFGSADEGRGKACKNAYRLAIIPAGSFDAKGKFKAFTDEADLLSQEQAYVMVPVTSVKACIAYIKGLKDGLHTMGRPMPPHGVVTRIKLEPDTANQFKVTFNFMERVNDSVMGAVMRTYKGMGDSVMFPYPKSEPTAAKAAAPGGKAKKPTAAAKARKY